MQAFNPAKIGNTKHAQGQYQPLNPKKYAGSGPILYRSSWEKDMCIICDTNPAIIEWAVEPFSIPYKDPVDGKNKNYWPDFLIRYVDATGAIKMQLIEIKPYKQTQLSMAKTKKDKIIVYVNYAKWEYALQYCKQNGMEFKVLTEKDLYKK